MLILIFIAGLFLLILGAEAMVRGACALAKKLKVSTLLIGIVIVGFGTSMPELLASLLSVVGKHSAPGIAAGNVIGSNIANVLLVLGLSAAVSPIIFEKKSQIFNFAALLISSAVLGTAIFLGGIGRMFGALMVLLMLSYIVYGIIKDPRQEEETVLESKGLFKSWIFSFLITIIGLSVMIGGAKLLVHSAIDIAKAWGVSETVIGLTIVAVGTSLPELAASLVSAIHKESGVAVGNIIGSNIFNALFILGVTGIIKPFPIPEELWLDFAVMLGTTILFIIMAAKRKIPRPAGLAFLLLYALYVAFLIKR